MKRMVFGAVCAGLILAASPTFAQTGAPTADASTPSPRRLELAKEVMDATGMQKQFASMFGNVMRQAVAGASKNLPQAAKARVDAFTQAETDTMIKYAPKFIEAATNAYARTYSEQELTDILAFYQSPSGQAMTAKLPLLMQNMMGDVMTMMPQIQHEMAVEACAKIACTAAEKHALLGGTAS